MHSIFSPLTIAIPGRNLLYMICMSCMYSTYCKSDILVRSNIYMIVKRNMKFHILCHFFWICPIRLCIGLWTCESLYGGFQSFGVPLVIIHLFLEFPWNKSSSFRGTSIYGKPQLAISVKFAITITYSLYIHPLYPLYRLYPSYPLYPLYSLHQIILIASNYIHYLKFYPLHPLYPISINFWYPFITCGSPSGDPPGDGDGLVTKDGLPVPERRGMPRFRVFFLVLKKPPVIKHKVVPPSNKWIIIPINYRYITYKP